MASKTVLKLLLAKYAPLSVEMQNAVNIDQAVIRDAQGTPDYVDAVEEQTAEIVTEEVKSKSEDNKARIEEAISANNNPSMF